MGPRLSRKAFILKTVATRKLNEIIIFVQNKFTFRFTDSTIIIVSVPSFEVDFFLEGIYKRLTLLTNTYLITNHLSITFPMN